MRRLLAALLAAMPATCSMYPQSELAGSNPRCVIYCITEQATADATGDGPVQTITK